jgi:hypothetical protein
LEALQKEMPMFGRRSWKVQQSGMVNNLLIIYEDGNFEKLATISSVRLAGKSRSMEQRIALEKPLNATNV